MDELTKQPTMEELSSEELNKVRGGSPPIFIIPPGIPGSGG